MPEYRIYQVNDVGKSSDPPAVGVFKDDNEAKTNARILFSRVALEIWCGDRKVATLKPSEPYPSVGFRSG